MKMITTPPPASVSHTVAPVMRGLFDIRHAAEYLDVSTATVSRWIHAGQLTSIKVSPRMVRISKRELDRFISELAADGEAI